jgi:mono/diheme cytochrome c family protein
MSTSLRSFLLGVLATLVLLGAAAAVFVGSGRYDIGADSPHTRPVYALMQTLRERSIRAHAAGLAVPDLDDPQLVLKGAGQYAAMCTQCHLSPAMADSEIRPGLYPQPPNLSRVRVDPKQAFWAIKHGIKMSAMPAWGASHDDATIWSMVAFVQKLPGMSAQEYRDIVARAPPDEDMEMGADRGAEAPASPHHDHDHGGAPDAH